MSANEEYTTCVHCKAPLADNQVVKDAYNSNTVNCWAKHQLRLLAEMAEDRDMHWFAEKLRTIQGELRLL